MLAYWLQMLRWAQAYKAMTCVIAMAQNTIRDAQRPGEESANDEAFGWCTWVAPWRLQQGMGPRSRALLIKAAGGSTLDM